MDGITDKGGRNSAGGVDGTDCTICLYDVLRIVSWVHLLVAEALFGGSEQLSG